LRPWLIVRDLGLSAGFTAHFATNLALLPLHSGVSHLEAARKGLSVKWASQVS
jgi:hypothetical protein